MLVAFLLVSLSLFTWPSMSSETSIPDKSSLIAPITSITSPQRTSYPLEAGNGGPMSNGFTAEHRAKKPRRRRRLRRRRADGRYPSGSWQGRRRTSPTSRPFSLYQSFSSSGSSASRPQYYMDEVCHIA